MSIFRVVWEVFRFVILVSLGAVAVAATLISFVRAPWTLTAPFPLWPTIEWVASATAATWLFCHAFKAKNPDTSAICVLMIAMLSVALTWYPNWHWHEWKGFAEALLIPVFAFLVDRNERLQKTSAQGVVGPSRRLTITSIATPVSQRLVAIAIGKAQRRRGFIGLTLLTGAAAAGAGYLYVDSRLVGAAVASFAVLIFALSWLVYLVQEILYLVGYQGMPGARLISPVPDRTLGGVIVAQSHAPSTLASPATAGGIFRLSGKQG